MRMQGPYLVRFHISKQCANECTVCHRFDPMHSAYDKRIRVNFVGLMRRQIGVLRPDQRRYKENFLALSCDRTATTWSSDWLWARSITTSSYRCSEWGAWKYSATSHRTALHNNNHNNCFDHNHTYRISAYAITQSAGHISSPNPRFWLPQIRDDAYGECAYESSRTLHRPRD